MTHRYTPNPNYQEGSTDPATRYPWKHQDQPYPPAPRLLRRVVFEDPGHAWLQVSLAELQQHGIAKDISKYSYMKGDQVFLEEDCDLGSYLRAVTKAGYTLEITTVYQEHTPIRSYDHYQPYIEEVGA